MLIKDKYIHSSYIILHFFKFLQILILVRRVSKCFFLRYELFAIFIFFLALRSNRPILFFIILFKVRDPTRNIVIQEHTRHKNHKTDKFYWLCIIIPCLPLDNNADYPCKHYFDSFERDSGC